VSVLAPPPARALAPSRHRRRRVAVGLAAVALPVTALGALLVGSSGIPIGDVLAALASPNADAAFVVRVLRLPRVLTAVLAGVALGASGFLLQGLLRNPLGSPDVMGVTAGAGLAVVVAIGAELPPTRLPLVAALGAGAATLLVHLLATRAGASGARLVLAGVGVHAAASAAVALVVARLPVGRLGAAEVWLAGSLHARNWEHVQAAVLGTAVALPLAFLLLRRLAVLQLGDESAVAVGVRLRSARAQLLACSALLAGTAVAVAGPLGFVALGAPHLARRVTGPLGGPALALSALLGGLLVLAADVVGQRLLAPTALPAGVVTAALGAPFLLWLLHTGGRR
jgi:iron complex transport system permease protein